MRILESPLHLKSSYLQLSGRITPDVAPAGMARIWYDESSANLKFSVNGGSFSENPGALALQDLTAWVLTNAPTASPTEAVLRIDSGTFVGSANGTYLGINSGGGTADLIRVQKAGADRLVLSETGILTVLKSVTGSTTASLGTATVHATDATTVGEVIRGAAAQTADMWQVQDNGGVARVAISDLVTAAEHTLTIRASPSQTGHTLTCITSDGLTTMFAIEAANAGYHGSLALGSATKFREQTVALGGQDRVIIRPKGSVFDILNEAGNAFQFHSALAGTSLYANANATSRLTVTEFALTLADAVNFVFNTTTGTKIGTVGGAAGQKIGFWNATPIVQPLLATGAGATADNIITVLQTLGLCRQT
jgi:hypothetical protein